MMSVVSSTYSIYVSVAEAVLRKIGMVFVLDLGLPHNHNHILLTLQVLHHY